VKLPGAASGVPIDGASINGGLYSRLRNFNSQIVFSPDGALLAHYRKTHLYYTDESWALPSPQGFLHASIPLPQQETTIATFGICMDLNPHLFLAPWSTYEFATYALASRAELVICSMAWLTRLSAEELGLEGESDVMADTHEDDSTHNKEITSQLGLRPDLDTLQYWLERLRPLIEADRDITVVIANRSGIEPGNWGSPFPDQHTQQSNVYDSVSSFPKCARFSAGEPIEIDGANAPEGTEEARYAGTSCVLNLGRGEFRVVGFMGRAEEGLRIWDTDDS
jgi:protein N-terminal amidase